MPARQKQITDKGKFVKTSFSIEPDLLEIAHAEANRRGFRGSFSRFLCFALREYMGVKIDENGNHVPPLESPATVMTSCNLDSKP
jgi:hypothetical protein